MSKQNDNKKGKKVIDSKKISKRLIALLSVSTILLTSCGNENKKVNNVSKYNKIKSSEINISSEDRYGNVLNIIADETRMDELLTENVNFHIMDSVNEYEKARQEEDVEKINLLISKIGLTTIKAKAFDAIPLNVEQIEKMSLTNIDNQITLFVYLNPISYDFGTINFYGLGDKLVYTLSGDRLNLVLNGIIKAQSETLNLEEIDLLYKSIIELMLEEVGLSENSNITFAQYELNSFPLSLFKSDEEKTYNNSLKYIKK